MTSTRVALLTGTNRGSGYATAHRLADDGWSVVAFNRTPMPNSCLTAEYLVDLADPTAVDEALTAVRRDTAGRIHALVPFAVSRHIATIDQHDPEELRAAFHVNVFATIRIITTLLPTLRECNAQIVLIGSHAGSYPFEGGLTYSTTKATLKALAETLLLEERPHGIRTTLVSAGAVSNFDWDNSPYKMSTTSIANTISAVLASPRDLDIGEIEVRPALLADKQPVTGFDRLAHI